MIFPVGETTLPQGKMTLPQGKMTLPQGKMTLPQGKMTLPEGKMTLPEGKMTLPEGKMALPEGKMALPTGEVDLAGAARRASGLLAVQAAGPLLAVSRLSHFTTQATAMAAMPSSLPTKPMRSLVVALTPT